MSSKAPLGQFIPFKTPVPRRDGSASLTLALKLKMLFDSICSAADRNAAIQECLEELLRVALLYMLELMTERIEESLPKYQQLSRLEDDLFLYKEDIEALLRLRTGRTDVWAKIRSPEPSSFATDLLIAHPERERVLWIHIAPGAGSDQGIIRQWKREKIAFSSALPRLAQQYLSLGLKQPDCVIIDPFLTEGRHEEDIWGLADLDELTERPGTAERVLRIRAEHRSVLRAKIGEALAPDEETQLKLIDQAFQRIAYEAAECAGNLTPNILRLSRRG